MFVFPEEWFSSVDKLRDLQKTPNPTPLCNFVTKDSYSAYVKSDRDGFILEFEVPGNTKDTVSATLTRNGILTVQYLGRDNSKVGDGAYSVEKTFKHTLPVQDQIVDLETISAKVVDGVLRVSAQWKTKSDHEEVIIPLD